MAGGRLRRALRDPGRATRTSRPSGASTCSTTAPRASPSSSTPRTAGAGRSRSPARRRSRATPRRHEGVTYRKLYDYTGQVTYVLGEFYWRLTRDQRTANTDYAGTGAASAKRLNREQTEGEGTRRSSGRPARRSTPTPWSHAFRLGDDKRAALQRDAAPTSFGGVPARQDHLLGLPAVRRADAVPLRRRRRQARLRRGAQHLRRGAQEYQSCLNSRRSGSGYRSGGGSFGGFSQRRRPQVAAARSSSGLFPHRRKSHGRSRMVEARGLLRLDPLRPDRRASSSGSAS